VDTAGQDVTWSRVFSLGTNSGISKSGAGTLTLNQRVTTTTSGIAVSEGTLTVPEIVLGAGTGVLIDVTGGGRLETQTISRESGTARPLFITGDGVVVIGESIPQLGNNSPITISGGVAVFFPPENQPTSGQLTIAGGLAVGQRLRNDNEGSSFGSPGNAARGLIPMGAAQTSGTLRITLGGNDTNRRIQIGSGAAADATGGARIELDGTAAQVFTNATFNVPNTSATVP
jgi:hypothetical protein